MLDFSQLPVEYKFIKTNRLSLKISQGKLVITVPKSPSGKGLNQYKLQKHVDSLISENLEWIKENLYKLASFENVFKDKHIYHNDILTELNYGEQHRLEFADGYIFVHNSWEGREKLLNVLRRSAKSTLRRRVGEIASAGDFAFSKVKIADQATRWGSCSTKGNINLNWRINLAPPQVRDYVIWHELAHTKQMNHSHKFWEIVESFVPDYRIRRKWLKTEGHNLYLV